MLQREDIPRLMLLYFNKLSKKVIRDNIDRDQNKLDAIDSLFRSFGYVLTRTGKYAENANKELHHIPQIINQHNSMLFEVIFRQVTDRQKLSVQKEDCLKVGDFFVKNGYRFVFGNFCLQAEPDINKRC